MGLTGIHVERPLAAFSRLAIDFQHDPLQSDCQSYQGFVGRGGVAAAHIAEGVGDGAVSEAEASGCLLLRVAFSEQGEDAALVRGGIARELVDGKAGRPHT